MNAPTCAECGRVAILVTGRDVYPHRPDLAGHWFWKCLFDGSYCGCHPNSQEPLGRPAGHTTRKARQDAHAAFDPLWKGLSRIMTREKAYRLLAQHLGLTRDACHIGLMDTATARRVPVVAFKIREFRTEKGDLPLKSDNKRKKHERS